MHFLQFLEAFDQFMLGLKAFSPPMLQTARQLLTNEQGGPLAQLCMTPELPGMYKTLGSIIVHTVAVLDSNSRQPILYPFIHMMTNPAKLEVSFHVTVLGQTCTIILIIEFLFAYHAGRCSC